MLSRVEVLKLVNPVQNVRDQLLEKQARGNAHLASELPRYSSCQADDEFISGQVPHPIRGRTVREVEVTHLDPNLDQAGLIERWQSKLDRSWVVKPCVRLEIHV